MRQCVSALLIAAATPSLALAEPDKTRICSALSPICIEGSHIPPSALIDAEQAYRALIVGLELPPPALALDGRVTIRTGTRTTSTVAYRDPLATVDRAVARLTVDLSSSNSCDSQLQMAHALARASLLGAAPSTDETTLAAQSDWLAHIAVPCAVIDRPKVFAPEQPLAGPRDVDEAPLGTVQFLDYIDRSYARDVGTWLLGAWANTVNRSYPGAPLVNEPDFFDIMAASFKTTAKTGWHDVFAAFAIERGIHLTSHQWEVPWPTKPRRLLSSRPVYPTGMAYIRIGPEGAPTRVRLSAEWEPQTLMRWVAVVFAADGQILKALTFTGFAKGGIAERSIEPSANAHHIEVIGVALEDREFKFDPDIGVGEPHAWILTVAND